MKKLRQYNSINHDFNKFLSLMNSSNKLNFVEKPEIKTFYSSIYVLSIWNFYVEDQPLKDIFSNNIIILSSNHNINKKITNFLMRNSVDNILKLYKLCMKYDFQEEKHIEDKFKQMKNTFKYISHSNIIFDRILTKYKLACNYVHSVNYSNIDLYSNVKEYLDRKNDIPDLKELFEFNKDINSILYLFYYDKLSNFEELHRNCIESFVHKNIISDVEKHLSNPEIL